PTGRPRGRLPADRGQPPLPLSRFGGGGALFCVVGPQLSCRFLTSADRVTLPTTTPPRSHLLPAHGAVRGAPRVQAARSGRRRGPARVATPAHRPRRRRSSDAVAASSPAASVASGPGTRRGLGQPSGDSGG